jgi:hypothetical protein
MKNFFRSAVLTSIIFLALPATFEGLAMGPGGTNPPPPPNTGWGSLAASTTVLVVETIVTSMM